MSEENLKEQLTKAQTTVRALLRVVMPGGEWPTDATGAKRCLPEESGGCGRLLVDGHYADARGEGENACHIATALRANGCAGVDVAFESGGENEYRRPLMIGTIDEMGLDDREVAGWFLLRKKDQKIVFAPTDVSPRMRIAFSSDLIRRLAGAVAEKV